MKDSQVRLTNIECEKCGGTIIEVPHWEYDGVTANGSYEPYYECINGCEQE